MHNPYRYEVIIYWSEEDNAFIAEIPELPGCCADGDSYQSALMNLEVIVDELIETEKSLDGLFRNPGDVYCSLEKTADRKILVV